MTFSFISSLPIFPPPSSAFRFLSSSPFMCIFRPGLEGGLLRTWDLSWISSSDLHLHYSREFKSEGVFFLSEDERRKLLMHEEIEILGSISEEL
jgi:hypothetical protein